MKTALHWPHKAHKAPWIRPGTSLLLFIKPFTHCRHEMIVIRFTNMGVDQVFLSIPSCAVLHIGEMPQKW